MYELVNYVPEVVQAIMPLSITAMASIGIRLGKNVFGGIKFKKARKQFSKFINKKT